MADEYPTLANMLAGDGKPPMLPQPRNALDHAPQNWQSLSDLLRSLGALADREGRYAGFYPARVLSRYMDPDGQSSFWNPQPRGLRMDQIQPTVETVSMMGTYEPGQRESTNVEDRRPKSIWEY